MKNIPQAFRDHLDKAVTSLCTCWRIVRTDGVSYYFTDADMDVQIGSETYLSFGAYSRTAIQATATLAVDNMDVTGISDFSLPENDLRNGKFDNADVYIFAVSWKEPGNGHVKLLRGFFGEVQVQPNGTYSVELRSLTQKLSNDYANIYSVTCRHDLGDEGCKVNLNPPLSVGSKPVPIPIKDASFSNLGRVGIRSSVEWYDPDNSGRVFTTEAPTFSGTHAARGAPDGRLVQDIDLAQLGNQFLDDIDAGNVSMVLNAYRRDNDARGRIRTRFLGTPMISPPHLAPRRLFKSSAISFSNSGIHMPVNRRLAGDFTVEFWFRMPASGIVGNVYLFDSTQSGSDGVGFGCRLQRWDQNTFRLFVSPTDAPTAGELSHDFTMNIELGEWEHFALVREGNNYIIYHKFNAISSVTRPEVSPFYFSTFGQAGTSTFRRGTLAFDEIRIWNRARTVEQIRDNAYTDLPSGTSGLIHYLPCEANSLTNLADQGTGASGNFTIPTGTASFLLDSSPVHVGLRRGSDYEVSGSAFDTIYSSDVSQSGDTGGVYDTGFRDVGNAWVKETIEVAVPRFARVLRIMFSADPNTGNPQNSYLDSLWGHFNVAGRNANLPRLSGSTGFVRGGVVIDGNARVIQVSVDNDNAVSGWYNGGLMTFYTGPNAGFSMEVKEWVQASGGEGTASLYLSLPFPVTSGDLFTIYPGCDKTRVCCAALFDNVINFFGFPDVPGEDELMRYPDAK